MATKAKVRDLQGHYNNAGEPIIIERREIIGQVVPDSNGEHSMLTTAMIQIGVWLEDHDDASGAQLAFQFAGRQFRVVLEPDERWIEAREERASEGEY